MISAVIGLPGRGKTIFMAYSALRFYAQGYKIYSNFNIYDPISKNSVCKQLITTSDLDRARNGRFELDEIPTWLDSRFSMSDKNAFVNSVLQKNRKRDISLEWSAQDFWMADVRLRTNTDYVIIPEIYYMINGQELHLKESYFSPINRKLLLPFAFIRAKMFTGWKYQNEKYLSEKDIIDSFSFKVQPISMCYDTSEEVKDLITSEMKKGIQVEKEALEILKTHYQSGAWVLNPESGIGMNSFDIEGYIDGKLSIIDVTTLKKANKNKSYLYLKGKDMNKYKAVEEGRQCKTFFMFIYLNNWYLLPSFHAWDCKKNTMPIWKVLEFCERLT